MSDTARDAGIQALKTGDAQAAVDHLTQAVEQNPQDGTAYGYLGAAYGQLNMTEKSVECLKKASNLIPTSAPLRFNLATALKQAGARDEAVADQLAGRRVWSAALDIEGVLVAQQAHVLELDAVAHQRQRHGLRAAAFAHAGRVGLAAAHAVHRIVGDGQRDELHVVALHEDAGAAAGADGGLAEFGPAGMGGFLLTLGLAGEAVVDQHDGRGIQCRADEGDGRLVLDADGAAVGAGLDVDDPALAAIGRHLVDSGLHRLAGFHDEVGRGSAEVGQWRWLPVAEIGSRRVDGGLIGGELWPCLRLARACG